jgi:hypothetical protein
MRQSLWIAAVIATAAILLALIVLAATWPTLDLGLPPTT